MTIERTPYFDPSPAEWPRCERCTYVPPWHATNCPVLAAWAKVRPTECPCCGTPLPTDPLVAEWVGCPQQAAYEDVDRADEAWLDARSQSGWHGFRRRLIQAERVRAFVLFGELVEHIVVQRRAENIARWATYTRMC